jgi:NitT/TauT family transport system substrate-binding protein
MTGKETSVRRGTWRRWVAVAGALTLMATACGDDDDGDEGSATGDDAGTGGEAPAETTEVRLQLQWVTQSQFAGYFAAADQGYYEEEGLDVEILEGAVDIVPQQVLASGGAEFAIAWVPKALVTREEGADIVNVAQVFQRSGTLEVTWADSGLETIEDLSGKRVGTWGFGNEFELTAALSAAGLDPDSDVEIVQQPFDMSLLLNREVDAAQAMTYNEYAQVLESENPDTGELYQPEDLNVIDFNEVGTAMLQDAIWADESWLAEEGNEDVAERFVRASLRGWVFCRDNFDECVDIVLDNGPTLGEGHMRWQLNEINKLIWPSPEGVGVVDQALWDQTIEVATSQNVIAEDPGDEVVRTDIAESAVAALEDEGLDLRGDDFEAIEVEVTPGGE